MLGIYRQTHDRSPYCSDDWNHGRCDTWIVWCFFMATCVVCRARFLGTWSHDAC